MWRSSAVCAFTAPEAFMADEIGRLTVHADGFDCA